MNAANKEGHSGGDALLRNTQTGIQTSHRVDVTSCLNIKQDDALRHVHLLTGTADALVTIVTIHADDDKPAVTRRGEMRSLWPWIEQQQTAGFGVYLTVNATNGPRRSKGDITRIRAVFLDDDTKREGVRGGWPIEPHFVVESSPGKYHYYWLVDEAPGTEFENLMINMAARYGTDGKAVDISRVLRLAGTVNLKPQAGSHTARIVSQSDRPRYTKGEVFASFPLDTITVDTLPSFDDDPVAQRLRERGMVKRERRDGGLYVDCPRQVEHSGSVTGATSCLYYPPHTGRFSNSNFSCMHAHCAGRPQRDFLIALGLDTSLRRSRQKAENVRLQVAGICALPSILTVDEMTDDCVLIEDGGSVGRISDSHRVLSVADFSRAMAASMTKLPAEGNAKPRSVSNTSIWLLSESRKSVATRTFSAGAPPICHDPDGRTALNSWRHIERVPATVDISPFLDQIAYLFADETDKAAFLDWLAHIEQRPGELPHFGWLHIAANTGTGRNWLASLTARLWRGQVAPNVDLPALFDSPFNGVLSGRVLAVVDEAQEGGNDKYRNINKLKSMVNAEYRDINPKYGRAYREHNACRWLVFSNHKDALPLNDTDRRWWVVDHIAEPRQPNDYAALYLLLSAPEFINSVAVFLMERDISSFNAGRRPPMTSAKIAALSASMSLVQSYADDLLRTWPSDIATNRQIAHSLSDGMMNAPFTSAMRRSLEERGCVRTPPMSINGDTHRCWILRNADMWLDKPPAVLVAEVCRQAFDIFA